MTKKDVNAFVTWPEFAKHQREHYKLMSKMGESVAVTKENTKTLIDGQRANGKILRAMEKRVRAVENQAAVNEGSTWKRRSLFMLYLLLSGGAGAGASELFWKKLEMAGKIFGF